MDNEITAIKHLGQGKIAVQWRGDARFHPVEDQDIALYIVYLLTRSPEQAFQAINSMCR